MKISHNGAIDDSINYYDELLIPRRTGSQCDLKTLANFMDCLQIWLHFRTLSLNIF